MMNGLQSEAYMMAFREGMSQERPNSLWLAQAPVVGPGWGTESQARKLQAAQLQRRQGP